MKFARIKKDSVGCNSSRKNEEEKRRRTENNNNVQLHNVRERTAQETTPKKKLNCAVESESASSARIITTKSEI